MIKVKLVHNPDKILSDIMISGHSETAVRGQDVPCAAVSALVRTFAGLAAERHVQVRTSGPGDMQFSGLENWSGEYEKALLEYLLLGLKAVAADYPEALEITAGR